MQSNLQVPVPPAPPAVPVPAVAIARAQQSLDALQIQLAQLQAQTNALEAQRRVMTDQIRHRGTEVRVAVAPVLAQVDAQLAETQARLADVRAEVAARQGGSHVVISGFPMGGFGRSPGFDPDVAAGLMFAFIFAVLMPISIAIAKRIWRGRSIPVAPPIDTMIAPRLDRLEQAVDAIAIEIERIAEGQRFVTKVMTERQSAGLPAANGAASSSASLS